MKDNGEMDTVTGQAAQTLYIDLLRTCLTRELFLDEVSDPSGEVRAARSVGRDWPPEAETMIGSIRLQHLSNLVISTLRNGVPGDLVEAGVWRGGASILMRGVLAALGDSTRTVWLADSFAGLPQPNEEAFPADTGLDLSIYPELAVGLDEVKANFARYGLLDDQVRFLVGWFKDTLYEAPIEKIALLRLDGDLYESTWQGLDALYPKLSEGGACVIDDYGCFEPCRRAVEDYRALHSISDPIHTIDWTGSYWIKS
jgi:O-methyltransferase